MNSVSSKGRVGDSALHLDFALRTRSRICAQSPTVNQRTDIRKTPVHVRHAAFQQFHPIPPGARPNSKWIGSLSAAEGAESVNDERRRIARNEARTVVSEQNAVAVIMSRVHHFSLALIASSHDQPPSASSSISMTGATRLRYSFSRY